MGDVISYPDVPKGDRDSHSEGEYAEGSFDELESTKLILMVTVLMLSIMWTLTYYRLLVNMLRLPMVLTKMTRERINIYQFWKTGEMKIQTMSKHMATSKLQWISPCI